LDVLPWLALLGWAKTLDLLVTSVSAFKEILLSPLPLVLSYVSHYADLILSFIIFSTRGMLFLLQQYKERYYLASQGKV
jgi:hypothetical protein